MPRCKERGLEHVHTDLSTAHLSRRRSRSPCSGKRSRPQFPAYCQPETRSGDQKNNGPLPPDVYKAFTRFFRGSGLEKLDLLKPVLIWRRNGFKGYPLTRFQNQCLLDTGMSSCIGCRKV